MKAISLWQPWASLWCSPAKVHETRHWPIAVPPCRRHASGMTAGVWLAVHAAKRFKSDVGLELDEVLRRTFGALWRTELPAGAIIGAVHVEGCYRTEDVVRCYEANPGLSVACPGSTPADDRACGDFAPGRFAWKRGAFRLLPEPVPWRGQQGLFEVPDKVLSPILPLTPALSPQAGRGSTGMAVS